MWVQLVLHTETFYVIMYTVVVLWYGDREIDAAYGGGFQNV